MEMEMDTSQIYWKGKNWEPVIISRGEALFYNMPVASGQANFTFEFPITKCDSLVLQLKPKRYYYLFAALHGPFQSEKTFLSDTQVRQYFDIILHADDTEVEAFIDKLDKKPNSSVRYFAKRVQNR